MDSETLTRRAWVGALGAGMWMPAAAAASDTPAAGLLDVRQFGAKGDGKTDDTRAIQKTIDAAAGQGGAVFVPPAVYACSELRLRPRVALVGVPAWNYRGGGGSTLKLIDDKAASLVNITGADGATIDGLSLEGGELGKQIHGILLDKPDYGKHEDAFRIERCQVARFSGDGVRLSRVWCFSIRHSMIAYSGGDGVRCIGWDGFLMDNWFSGNGGAGFAGRGSASITLTGNRIEWNRDAGILASGGSHYNITGNYIDRSGTSAIHLAESGKCSQMTITGNLIYRSGKHAELDTPDSCHIRIEGAKGITAVGNTMHVGRDDGGKGTYSPSYGIVCKRLENCVIKDNVLHEACLRELIADKGEHSQGVIVKDNPGCVFKPA
ncbi:MAG: right-handed parallel beta-helix repeat-containing protein [Acidobacteriota bacterium]